MHAQLEILLQIQDLKAQRRELIQGDTATDVQRDEFGLDIEAAAEQLEEKIGDLESELEPTIRSRYNRLAASMDRVVVPAINGTCYGCFVAVPTAIASDPDERNALNNCAHCGRFLYFMG